MRALTVSFKDGSCAVTWRFQFDELVVSAGNKLDKPDKMTSQRLTTALNYQYECNEGSGYVWDAASLSLTGSKAASISSFNQNTSTLLNHFEAGMKLESDDPRRRNMDASCIASVVGKQGPRVQLRLDGSDCKNDFWRMIDCVDLHPIGTCERNHELLQPPLGFTKQPIQWNNFRKKTLSNATFATDQCFHEPPPPPTSNTFTLGEKLEAVDRKNPQLICPATVGNLSGDQIHVCFDGWRGAFDYWCRYDDRDIFPVGWTAWNDHPLQHPGVVVPLVKKSKSTPAGSTNYSVKDDRGVTSISPKPGQTVHGPHSKNKAFNSAKVSPRYDSKFNLLSPKVGAAANVPYSFKEHPRPYDNISPSVILNELEPPLAKIPRMKAEMPSHKAVHTPFDAHDWGIEKVIEFICKVDQSMNVYMQKFRDLEIDGKAFLLMDNDKFMRYMSLKLGPALKLTDISRRLRTGKFFERNDL